MGRQTTVTTGGEHIIPGFPREERNSHHLIQGMKFWTFLDSLNWLYYLLSGLTPGMPDQYAPQGLTQVQCQQKLSRLGLSVDMIGCEAWPLSMGTFQMCEKCRTVQVGGDLGFSTVSNGEQFLLVIEKLLACFCRKLLILG
jgi:hypothetical protein